MPSIASPDGGAAHKNRRQQCIVDKCFRLALRPSADFPSSKPLWLMQLVCPHKDLP